MHKRYSRDFKDVISPEKFLTLYADKKTEIGVVIGSRAYEDEIYDFLIENEAENETEEAFGT